MYPYVDLTLKIQKSTSHKMEASDLSLSKHHENLLLGSKRLNSDVFTTYSSPKYENLMLFLMNAVWFSEPVIRGLKNNKKLH